MTELMRLGVCYYPEHWSPAMWPDDARRMVAAGISRVRIGEFAWSRIEPEPGRYDWEWLDTAVAVLADAGLGIIMGTPTATPPRWLVNFYPDMVALDADGRPRGFGSRRHYCFSHAGYLDMAKSITRAMAGRYGKHPAVVMWQTDNEYGCHDTAVSFSPAARAAFQQWLMARYGHIDALNQAWGTVFWSMTYLDFGHVELPNLTVTEANPAHWLDFRRFSSDQVAAFNQAQVDIIRAGSPGRDITHNLMGFFTQFDHHQLGRQLDLATWDSYPLGFLEQFWFSSGDKAAYRHQGHPDIAAFHHDLYRGVSGGRWGVMEQQPGPVNWARFNPAPLPGMVRLWTLEALAHGAELVSYFRWRQFPRAQEQMHSGLVRPDNRDDVALAEVRAAADDIAAIGPVGPPPRTAALVFAYDAAWVTDIQPHGQGFGALRVAFEFYTALRELGLDVDIVPPGAPLGGYALVVVPCVPIVPDALAAALADFAGPVLVGPRTGSKTDEFAIPAELPPGPLQPVMPIRVVRVESLPDAVRLPGGGGAWHVRQWVETVEPVSEGAAPTTELALDDGRAVLLRAGRVHYLAAMPDAALAAQIAAQMAALAGLAVLTLPPGVRVRRAGGLLFAFNTAAQAAALAADALGAGSPAIGLPPAGAAVFNPAAGWSRLR